MRFAQARVNLIRLADKIIDGRVAQRENGNTDDNDFLTSLLENKAEKSYIQDAIICFFFAGQDNITNSLGWSLHELSRHPLWLQRMREEAKEQNPNGEIINYNALSVSSPRPSRRALTVSAPAVPDPLSRILRDDAHLAWCTQEFSPREGGRCPPWHSFAGNRTSKGFQRRQPRVVRFRHDEESKRELTLRFVMPRTLMYVR